MTEHTWCDTGYRRTSWEKTKKSVYTCVVCETTILVGDSELAIEAAEKLKVEPNCGLVVVKSVINS